MIIDELSPERLIGQNLADLGRKKILLLAPDVNELHLRKLKGNLVF
jgi:hypothetical protein